MGFSKLFLNAGEALRPVLTKIIPMKLLSKMKAGIINNATDKLSADSIAKYEPGSIWGGVPAKFIKKVDPEQAKELNQKIAHNYLMYSDWYK